MKSLKRSSWLPLIGAVMAGVPLMAQTLQKATEPPSPPAYSDFHAEASSSAQRKAPAQQVPATIEDMAGKYMALGYTTANVAQRY